MRDCFCSEGFRRNKVFWREKENEIKSQRFPPEREEDLVDEREKRYYDVSIQTPPL